MQPSGLRAVSGGGGGWSNHRSPYGLSSTSGRPSCAARLGHGAPGRVLEIGQHVQEPGVRAPFGRQVVDVDARVVAAHTHHLGLHRREGLQRAQVGGRLDHHPAAGVDQHLGDQVQPLLRTGGDQHLARVHLPRQRGGDHLEQRAETLAGRILQRCVRVVAQHVGAGARELGHRKGLRRRQAAGEADDARALGDLEYFADHGRIHLRGAPREHPRVVGGWVVAHFSPPGGP